MLGRVIQGAPLGLSLRCVTTYHFLLRTHHEGLAGGATQHRCPAAHQGVIQLVALRRRVAEEAAGR